VSVARDTCDTGDGISYPVLFLSSLFFSSFSG